MEEEGGGASSGAFQRDNGEKYSTSGGGEEISQGRENEVRGLLRIEKKGGKEMTCQGRKETRDKRGENYGGLHSDLLDQQDGWA